MRTIYRHFSSSVVALSLIAMTSFGAAPAAAVASTTGPLSASQAATPGVTDADIAAIVVAANNIDIDAGKLAVSKTTNPKVKAFAEQMIKDHTAINNTAVALVTKLGVTPHDNDTSNGLKSSADATRSRLSGLSGKEFDKAYIDNEVAYHKLVLGAVDKTLIPSAQNAELKATLVKTRPLFVAHLKHAEMVQASVEKGSKAKGTKTHAM